MSAQKWNEINYEAVPSYAARNYRDAFVKHDEDRYNDYLKSVEEGESKINTSTLYPYDIVSEYTNLVCRDGDDYNTNSVLEDQWEALPNYVTDGKKFLVMADVSGSMYGRPMDTSVSLAIYFAERNPGAFHGKFITFTDQPKLVTVPDNLTLGDKVNAVMNDVGYDTNLEAAFNLILDAAINGHLSQEDLPDAILVISDMEINDFGEHENTSFTRVMSYKFIKAGYKMPTLVYWNINARMNTFHAEANDDVRFVSGSSPSVFAGLCNNMGYSATELMLATLNSERYEPISL